MVGRGHHRRWKAATCGLALATALPAPARAQDAAELRTVLFGSLEAGRSSFANVGAKHALGGPLDRSGPALMAVAGYGGRFERDQAAPGTPLAFRHAAQGSTLVGYQQMLGWGALAAFVGPEIDYETFAHDRAGGGESGPKFGARLHGEAWLNPSPDTLVTATLIAGSARPSLWSRGSLGYRLWRNVFVGPEASATPPTAIASGASACMPRASHSGAPRFASRPAGARAARRGAAAPISALPVTWRSTRGEASKRRGGHSNRGA